MAAEPTSDVVVEASGSHRVSLPVVGPDYPRVDAETRVVFAGPILLSTDVFSYIAYARMGVEHGLNPYTHGPIAIMGDPIYRYVGVDWKHVATAYGPLYTLITYPLAPLGLRGALWGMKVEALVGSAVTLWLVWRCARTRGL